MRKKFTLTLSGVFVAMVLIGCGGTSKENTQKSVAAAGAEITAEPETEAGDQQTVVDDGSETEDTITWFDSKGLTITPQGEFTYTTMSVDIDDNDVETFEVPSKVVITETTEGVEEGYKKVVAVFNEDVMDCPEYSYWNYISAFDRYTGTSFEFDPETVYTETEDEVLNEGFVTIGKGEESYNISLSIEGVNEFPDMEETITVTCPIDYDGVVFQIGYCDSEMIAAYAEMDMAARLYTIDEFPFYGEGYYYFSYSNK